MSALFHNILRRRGLRVRAILLFCAILQAALLGLIGARWWAGRNNSLYGRGDWSVVKDEGKFVFHTYEYMFGPLTGSILPLNASMGFQEVLFRQPEDESRRLRRLRAEILLSRDAYLWVVLRKSDSGLRAFRLSRSEGYPSGFFRYGPEGDLLSGETFDLPLHRDHNELDLRFERNSIILSLNGEKIRRIEDFATARGRFGFRGCGNLRAACAVKNIRLDFEDPLQPERRWSFVEKFNTRREVRRLFPLTAALAVGLLVWRLWRRSILAGLLPPGRRSWFLLSDDLAFLIVLLLTAGGAYYGLSTAIPFGFLAAELASWTLLAIGRKGTRFPGRVPAASSLLFPAAGLLLLLAAVGRHGRYFGRSRMVSPGSMSYVHLDAMHLDPDPGTTAGSFRLESPVTLVPGRPFFIPGRSFREQRILMSFVPEAETTLDLVFQQQTFRTRGDPAGEPILYQRRTLRLSARSDVASGMSPETSFRLNPVYRLHGSVRPGETNHLELVSTGRGVTVQLNGETTDYPGLYPLAYGETGAMVFENSVRIERLEVAALGVAAGRGGPGRWMALLWIGLFLGAVLLLWPADRRAWSARIGWCAAAAWPAMLYLAGTAGLSPGGRFFLGMERVLWMDILLAAAASGYLFLVLLLRKTSRAAPAAFNLAVVVLLALVLLVVWDYLPDDHPVKARSQAHVIFPAAEPVERSPNSAPWYTNNRLIGANTYLIHQQFGGKTITVPKPAGTVRVFGLGGSQAWGSGAASSAETFYALLGRELTARGLPVEMYNASVNGMGIPNILNVFLNIILPFEPDILIIDTGLNDSMALRQIRNEDRRSGHREILFDLFGQILDLAGEHGIDVLLCLEPVSGEMPLRPDADLYRGLTTLAAESGVPVVSPLAAVAEAEVDSFVWWDMAHFAPYGHTVMTRLLLPETESLVRRRLGRMEAERRDEK